ncbi:type II secretion system secretin GspD [Methylocella silvestris]|uniref:Type II secretion system protein GspD n=1 Tax=Methylocella silvestris TaxID=199596 RepID=A0A2J7TCK5_METSI|nr:type II secretion system secretin GspD [Methylocella silvestris]PNG24506.1 type II secretion system protein GspD [Methylocella silvestris]
MLRLQGRAKVYLSSRVISAGLFVCISVLVAACAQSPLMGGGNEAPDAVDRVRGLDLQPRFPKSSDTVNTGVGGNDRPQLYYGSTADGSAAASGGGDSAGAGSGAGGGGGVDLNFENAPITAVAKVILGDVLGLGYAVDPRVQGTITLSSGRPVPKSRLLSVLESALRTSNAVLVHDAGGYRIIPVDDAVGNGSVDRGGSRLEPGYGMTVVPVQHVSVQTINKLLEGFATRPGAIRVDSGTNMVIIVGTGVERRTAVDTVLSFDQDWMRGQSVGIIPVRNTTPEPIVVELEKILDSGEAGLSQNMVKVQAMNRSNAVLVVARKPELLRAAATWIARLDGSATASTGVKVYRVRYGDAKLIARLLSDLFTGGASSSDSAANSLAPGSGSSVSTTDRLTGGTASLAASAGGGGSAGSSLGAGSGSSSSSSLGAGAGSSGAGSQSPFGTLGSAGAAGGAGGADSSAAGGAGSSSGGLGGGGKGPVLLPGVRIMADTANNSVVIYANQQSYKVIEKALEQLDRPKLQVAIDLTIAEVTLNDTLNYGVQFFLGSSNLGLGTNNGFVTNTASSIPLSQTSGSGGTTPGFNLTLGNAASPRVIINALHQYTDVKVLSNPSLVVVDNQVATLQVGDEIPIQTGSATVLSANNAVVNTIDYKNTGIILRVQPRVNFNGNVSLDVEQEISNQAGTSALGPTFSQRKVKSSILVASGQTVLLAGLISDGVNGTKAGIPVADQIPVLGNLFNNNSNRLVSRTELIIFIRPQIIRDGVDASFVAEELRSKLRGNKVGDIYPTGAVTPVPLRALQQ